MYKKIIWLFICIISTLFFACTAEKDKGDYLKGRVLIDGQPSSGVLVRLYDYPQVNDTLEYLQSQYPGIGVKVTRQLNFDKNAQSVIREVYSDKNGNWEMDNLSTGSYVAVYLKDGLCKNQYGVTVGSGGSNAGDFDFGKPFIYKNDSTITGNVIWPAGSSVYIQGKIVVDEMATLTVEPGVSIAFSDSAAAYPKGELAIYGKAEFVGTEVNYISFSGLGELKNAWNGVKVGERAEGKFRYCAFYNGYAAIISIKSKPDVENCLFANNRTGLNFEANRDGNIYSNSFINNGTGIYGKPADSITFNQQLLYKNNIGMRFLGPSKFSVNNTIFHGNMTGFRGSSSMAAGDTAMTSHIIGSIEHCEFTKNTSAVNLSGDNLLISKNNFSDSKNSHISMVAEINSYNSRSKIIDNNFYISIDYIIYYKGYSPNYTNSNNLLATNNYWNGVTDSSSISDKIFDHSTYTGKIIFWPPAIHEITGAGIINSLKKQDHKLHDDGF